MNGLDMFGAYKVVEIDAIKTKAYRPIVKRWTSKINGKFKPFQRYTTVYYWRQGDEDSIMVDDGNCVIYVSPKVAREIRRGDAK